MILSPILRPRADMEMSLMAAGECALLPVFAVCCVEVVEMVELLLGAGDLGTAGGRRRRKWHVRSAHHLPPQWLTCCFGGVVCIGEDEGREGRRRGRWGGHLL